MFYLNNQHFDPIIRLVVSAGGGSYFGMKLLSPPQEWLKERSMDIGYVSVSVQQTRYRLPV